MEVNAGDGQIRGGVCVENIRNKKGTIQVVCVEREKARWK